MVNLAQFYDPLNGHRMLLVENRWDGNNLYADADANYERVIAAPGTMVRYYPGIGVIVPNKDPSIPAISMGSPEFNDAQKTINKFFSNIVDQLVSAGRLNHDDDMKDAYAYASGMDWQR